MSLAIAALSASGTPSSSASASRRSLSAAVRSLPSTSVLAWARFFLAPSASARAVPVNGTDRTTPNVADRTTAVNRDALRDMMDLVG